MTWHKLKSSFRMTTTDYGRITTGLEVTGDNSLNDHHARHANGINVYLSTSKDEHYMLVTEITTPTVHRYGDIHPVSVEVLSPSKETVDKIMARVISTRVTLHTEESKKQKTLVALLK